MKKHIIFISILLILFIFIFGFYIFSVPLKSNIDYKTNIVLQDKILKKSSWINLTSEDFNGYLNGTYTNSINTIIKSLENAIPVILQTSNDKFNNSNNGTFIVLSNFDSNNNIYIYYYDSKTNSYKKTSASFEYILEDAISAFIYKESEEL